MYEHTAVKNIKGNTKMTNKRLEERADEHGFHLKESDNCEHISLRYDGTTNMLRETLYWYTCTHPLQAVPQCHTTLTRDEPIHKERQFAGKDTLGKCYYWRRP